MELIYARSFLDGVWELRELGFINEFEKYNCILSEKADLVNNDFELQLSLDSWTRYRILEGDWIYIPQTEWGGRVEKIERVGEVVKVTGPTFRGLTTRHVIPPGYNKGWEAYRNVNAELNYALKLLYQVNTFNGSLSAYSTDPYVFFSQMSTGITFTYAFRFNQYLEIMTQVLKKLGYRIEVTHEYFDYTTDEMSFWINGKQLVYRISAKPVIDYSNVAYFNEDYGITINAKNDNQKHRKYLICLGSGELEARDVVILSNDDSGVNIVHPSDNGVIGYCWDTEIYDYPNAESIEELIANGTKKLVEEYKRTQQVSFNVEGEGKEFFLGDIIGGRDSVTGIESRQSITKKELTIDKNGERITYEVG